MLISNLELFGILLYISFLKEIIRSGKFLTFALRPIHHPFFALSQKIGHRMLGILLEALPCGVIFVLLFKVA